MADRPLSIDIRKPLLLKVNALVLLTQEDGSFPLEILGFGLFYRDTCYLGAYLLRLHDTEPLMLMASDAEGMAAKIELTNSSLRTTNGEKIPDHKLSLRRTLLVLDDGPVFVDTIALRNFTDEAIVLPLSLEFCTTFESMFVLRGTPPGKRGRLLAPEWDGTALRFCYEGADGVRRTLLVGFSLPPIVAPRTTEQRAAHFELSLASRASLDLIVTCRVDKRPVNEPPPGSARAPRSAAEMRAAKEAAAGWLLDGYARLETSSKGFGETTARSLSDLALLEVQRGEHRFTAAGVPWFVGLFGRDSLLPTLQCLAFNPDLGARTVRALAHLQGKKDDETTREQPGKVLHELRVGELAHLHEVSQIPSYAAVDATLLFLIAIARHVDWTGDLALFEELRPNIDAALGWLSHKLSDGQGYITYDGLADGKQPVNQSWRDSGIGVLRADGSYPVPPLALVEVQVYAFQALTLIAALLRRLDEAACAERLEADASDLRQRFLRNFWIEAQGCYCLALEQGGKQVASVTSNAAQVLWTGIASQEHAAKVAARIMRPDMFSGWSVRTLSAEHAAFDPLAYQQGSVWPFDNALIVSGLRRYGEDTAALRIMAATLDAAHGFRRERLPEFIAGTQRQPGDGPTHTPRADPMQAWSAAAIPFMVTELLGLYADGFGKRLHVRWALLPDGVDGLLLHGLRHGGRHRFAPVHAPGRCDRDRGPRERRHRGGYRMMVDGVLSRPSRAWQPRHRRLHRQDAAVERVVSRVLVGNRPAPRGHEQRTQVRAAKRDHGRELERHGNFALHPPVRIEAHELSLAIDGRPVEAIAIDLRPVRSGWAVDLGKQPAARHFAASGVVVPGVDFAGHGMAVIHRATVRAPGQPIGQRGRLAGGDEPVALQAPQRSLSGARLTHQRQQRVAHWPDPEPAGTVAFAVIKEEPARVVGGGCDQRQRASGEFKPISAGAQRDQHAAIGRTAAEREATDPGRHDPALVDARLWIKPVQRRLLHIDPVEPGGALAPDRAFAGDRRPLQHQPPRRRFRSSHVRHPSLIGGRRCVASHPRP